MYQFARSTFLLAGLISAAVLCAQMAGPAQAADPEVQIIQKVDSPAGPGTRETALTASHNTNGFVRTSIRHVNGVAPTQRWIEHQTGQNFFSYENVYWQQCLTAINLSSGSNLKVQPCTPGNRSQMWTQGFSSGEFRKLQNLKSGYAATLKKNAAGNNTTGDVIQAFDQGLKGQRWSIVPPG